MTEAATQQRRTAHLPEQPAERFGTFARVRGQEFAKLFCQVKQDIAGLEHPAWRGNAVIHQGGNFRVGIHLHKAAAKLVAILDIDQPGIVFRILVAFLKQLFEHHRDLYPVGGGQGVKLQGMLAHLQGLVMGGPGDRAIDIGKGAAIGLVPLPDTGWGVGGVRHSCSRSMTGMACAR